MIDLDVDKDKPLAFDAANAAGILLTAVILACGAAATAGLLWFATVVLSWIG